MGFETTVKALEYTVWDFKVFVILDLMPGGGLAKCGLGFVELWFEGFEFSVNTTTKVRNEVNPRNIDGRPIFQLR